MNQNWENCKKPSFRPNFGPFSPNLAANIFFKNLALSVTRYHGQLSSCTTSEKNNDPIFSDGWTDGRTDCHTDESDFIRHCQLHKTTSNVQQFTRSWTKLPIFMLLEMRLVEQNTERLPLSFNRKLSISHRIAFRIVSTKFKQLMIVKKTK